MKVLAVIPARGGSKSVPLKNIKLLNGRPLLAYAVESALNAKSIDCLVVSTDHDEIIRVAEQCGARVVRRPPELATDEARTEGCLIHAADVLEEEHFKADLVLTLEPTSPFRTANLIDRCVDIFMTTDADSVIGVVETRGNYGRIVNGQYRFLFPDLPRRRQDRDPLYQEASTIYGTETAVLRRKQSVLGDRLHALIVPEEEMHDINTPFDFEIAELRMKAAAAKRRD